MNVEMTGFPKGFLYYNDLFHTLVNLKNWRFTALLFAVYFLLFVVFAVPFYIDVSFARRRHWTEVSDESFNSHRSL